MPDELTLCFHGVGTPRRVLEPGEDLYWITEDTFLRVLDEVASWPVPVTLTFDDGNRSDLDLALPALLERGLHARFYVLSGRFDDPGALAPQDVRTLHDAGMTIGTHGMAHTSWRHLSPQRRQEEFVTARTRIEDAVGLPVTEAACPLGRYDRSVLAALRAAGYTRVYTSDRRPGRGGRWLQPRYSLRSVDDVAAVRSAVLDGPSAVQRAKLEAIGLVKRLR